MKEIEFDEIYHKLVNELQWNQINVTEGKGHYRSINGSGRDRDIVTMRIFCSNKMDNPMGTYCLAHIYLGDLGERWNQRYAMNIQIDQYYWEYGGYGGYDRYKSHFAELFLKIEDRFGIMLPEMCSEL